MMMMKRHCRRCRSRLGDDSSGGFFSLVRMGLVLFVLPFCCYSILIIISSSVAVAAATSSTPVIGIMTQPLPNDDESNSTYIAASYVKWLELGGARSIAIPYDATEDVLEDIFYQVNGILLPGGALDILPDSMKYLWKLILQANSGGNDTTSDFFPVWGTCLGFEWLIELACSTSDAGDMADDDDNNTCYLSPSYQAENISLPLYNIPSESRLYPPNSSMKYNVQHYNLTMNNHHRGITPTNFNKSSQLTNLWYITSTNYDILGSNQEFVSTIEPKHPNAFPIYGVQYHPEKNIFEYVTFSKSNIPYESIDHTIEGISMSFELSKFFVNLTRHNMNLQQRQRHKQQGHVRRVHEYTKFETYPYVYIYPIQLGVYHFEQIYIIPPSTSAHSLASSETATSVSATAS